MARNIIILRLLVTRRGEREERGRGEGREREGQGGRKRISGDETIKYKLGFI